MSNPHAQTRDFGDGSVQARRPGGFGGTYPQIFFVTLHSLLYSEKFVLNIR